MCVCVCVCEGMCVRVIDVDSAGQCLRLCGCVFVFVCNHYLI